jgi:Fuc2NAc and GlcNAc transferase
MDTPNERSSHSVPTPRGGGAALVTVATIGLAIAIRTGMVGPRLSATLIGGMGFLALIGWRDDAVGLSARVRLLAQVAVAAWATWMLGGLPALRAGPFTITLGVAGYALGLLGIVWSINLFNFMDGIDGIAGSQAVLIFAIGAALLFFVGNAALGTAAAILAAASGGFLPWNWPPAKIFMGDVGSGALGYAVATLAVASENAGAVPLVAFGLLGGVFIVDATVTLARRMARGENPSVAHRSHAYQRLSRRWGSHRPVTMAAAALTLFLGALAYAVVTKPSLQIPGLVAGWGLLVGLLVAVERREPMFPKT